MWGTDMTMTMTAQEGKASIFLAVEHSSLECAGIYAARPGTGRDSKPWSRFARVCAIALVPLAPQWLKT